MAAGRRRKRRSSRRRHGRPGLPRGVAMGTLLLVAIIALGWYFRSVMVTTPVGGEQAVRSSGSSGSNNRKPAPGTREKPAAPRNEPGRFEFYDMLPEAKVDMNVQPPVAPAVRPPVSEPGIYVIQAGAFPDFAEADKVKAQLALLGIVAVIQKVETNGTVFNRVRIGPIRDLAELNRIRDRLRDRHIEYLLIPVNE